MEPMTWPGEMVSRGDVDLWCHDSAGSGSTVLLLHGLAGHSGEWAATMQALSARHRVVAFDQRGHGRSTRNPMDVSREAFVQDVLRVIVQLDSGPVTLVGQSMGAHTALLAAAQAPPDAVARLVLVEGGVGGGGAAVTDPVARLLRSWPVPFPDARTAAAYFGGGAVGATWAAGLEAKEGGLFPRFDVDVMITSLAAVHERECWEEWARVRVPTLLVQGERGDFQDEEAERMQAHHAHCERVTVAGAGHDVHLEAPEIWTHLLHEFIDTN